MVIKHSIKLMRLLNSNIVDKGVKGNTKNKKAFRFINIRIFENLKEGETFRLIIYCIKNY